MIFLIAGDGGATVEESQGGYGPIHLYEGIGICQESSFGNSSVGEVYFQGGNYMVVYGKGLQGQVHSIAGVR